MRVRIRNGLSDALTFGVLRIGAARAHNTAQEEAANKRWVRDFQNALDDAQIEGKILEQLSESSKSTSPLARGLIFASIGVSCIATQAAAQATEGTTQTLEEIIVTAERRTTDIQKTAASVSVRTGEELAEQGRYTTRQILEDIPGITAVDNSSLNVGSADVQGNNITIRGITPGATAAGGPSGISAAAGAAVYVDGVYEGVGSGYDIERVEVLRGPQGTLYGRSATTGVVAFHTRNPSLEGFGGNASVEYGNYDLQHYSAAVNLPLTDGLAARVSGDYRDQGEPYNGQAGRGMGTSTNGRAKLLWQPNDAFSLLVGFAYAKNEAFSGGYSATAAPPTLALTESTTAIYPGYKQQRQYWAEVNWDVGPVTITYLPAFRTWYQDDHLFSNADFLSSGAPLNQLIQTPKDDFNTHELRVASKDDAAVQWQAGVFYYHNELQNSNHNYLVSPSGGELAVISDTKDQKDTKNLGYFAETTIPFTASLRMTLGARYDDTKVVVGETLFDNPYAFCGTSLQNTPALVLPSGATCTGVAQASVPPPAATTISGIELNFHNFNYKARIEYDLTQKNMLYGMISTGFRPGDAGINSTTRAANIVDAEKLTSIEVGSKNRFLDDSLQVNVGVYYYNYRGFRTSYRPDTDNDADYASISGAVSLTVPAKYIGGELELLYQLTAHDRVGFNFNYVESHWYDAPAEFTKAQPETKRAMTPYTITANYEHVFNLPGGSILSARIDGKYEAAHLAQNLHVDYLRIGYDQYARVGSRTIGNLSAAWASEGGRYSISAYVRNFTDTLYTSYNVAGDKSALTVSWTDPRTYGAQASVRF
jgi:outer membrane receptor protein involved in Fe transport